MNRREFIALLGGAAAAPLAARARQSDKMRLIGVLMGSAEESDPAARLYLAAFRDGLSKLGWTADSNLQIELRWGAGNSDKIATFAKELIKVRPDAIFGMTTPVIDALARETRTIPIVFALLSDPIGGGFAASFAHPGGNVTGFVALDAAMGGKWVGLLKEIAPDTVRVALLFNPATTSPLQFYLPSIQAAASTFAVEVNAAPVHAKEEIEGVIAAQAHSPGAGVILMPDAFNLQNSELIIGLAARYRVPTIYFNTDTFAGSGGLITYGDDYAEECRLAAGYVDRILKGAKPADLPIQLPTKFKLVINTKTAKALGLIIPPTLLATADEVIE
jgi:putative ABC transport system substrate-binding protein